jgi:uncharacterized protein YoxC
MTHTTVPRNRVAALLGLAAIILALLAHPGDSFAAPQTDPELAAAAAAVRDARKAVDRAKTATMEARAHHDKIRDRVTRKTAARDTSADRVAGTQRALATVREKVRDARTRVMHAKTRAATRKQAWKRAYRKWRNASAQQKPARAKERNRAWGALNRATTTRKAARHHLHTMRKRKSARQDQANAATSDYLAAQGAVDRATMALARAQTHLTGARTTLGAARVVLAEAKQRYAELAAQMPQEATVAVANIPNRVGATRFTRSMRTLAANRPDFITLNEISKRTERVLQAATPGYGAYRGGAKLTALGAGNQSINNAVMWRTDTYQLLGRGRIRVVNDDRGYHHKKPFIWDRYATWVTLRRISDNQITSVISTHMPTNPAKFKRQHGNPKLTRVQLYARGMNKLIALAERLGQQGRVLVGGDMNSHPNQGYWSAVAKMTSASYGYTKDRGVMYLFHPLEASVTSSRQLSISSDHPALVTTVQFG